MHLSKRKITEDDVIELINRCNELFSYSHGWSEFLEKYKSVMFINYCTECNIRILSRESMINNSYYDLIDLGSYIKDRDFDNINDITHDEYIIKQIIE